jgi:hypothetical protein
MSNNTKNQILNFISELAAGRKDNAGKVLTSVLNLKGKTLMKEARDGYSTSSEDIPVGLTPFVYRGHKVEAEFRAKVVAVRRYDVGDRYSPPEDGIVGIKDVLYVSPVKLTIDGISAEVNIDGLDIEGNYAQKLYVNLQNDLVGEESTVAEYEPKFYNQYKDFISDTDFIRTLTKAIVSEIKDMENSDY